jgi:signal transduction histidine kinase
MWTIAVFDLISSLAIVSALVVWIRGWRGASFPRDAKFLFLVLIVFSLFYYASLFIQWSGITDAFDPVEDVIGALIPMLWAFFFYAFLQDVVSSDLRQSREALHRAHDELEEKVKARTSEIREAYQKLENAYQKIKQNQDRIIRLERRTVASRITSTLAHETRNPIAAIGGFARILQKKFANDPELAPHFVDCLEEIQKLERLTAGILKAGREASADFERLDTWQVLEELYELCRERARLSGVRLTKDIEPLTSHIIGDKDSLIAALKEIVFNAIEASTKDEEVELRISREDEWVVFSVKDQGEGIAKESLAHIYDPFFSTKKLSTGMGLSFAKELIEVQNGYIRIDTKLGEGTTVYVYLPFADDQ